MWKVFESGIVLGEDSSAVRVALRIYFTAILLLVTWLGSRICVLRPQLFLMQRGRVPVMEMTGWLSAFDAARTMWLTRSNPLGLMGLAMVLVGTIMTVSDIAVSGLVVSRNVPGICPVNATDQFWVFPDANWTFGGDATSPFDWSVPYIEGVDRTNALNGGVPGLYRTIDTDPHFRATEADIHGSWRCADMGVTAIYNHTIDMWTVQADLQRKGLMYGEENPIYGGKNKTWFAYSIYPDMTPEGVYLSNRSFSKDIFFMSTNDTTDENDNSITPWDVLVAMQLTSKEFEPKRLNSYHCKLRAPTAEWIWTWTDASSMLYTWHSKIGRVMYQQSRAFGTKVVPNPVATLESNLNIMTISLGVLQGENGTDADGVPLPRSSTKGCVLAKTLIPWPIVGLFIFVALLLLWAAIYEVFLEVSVRKAVTAYLVNGNGSGSPYGNSGGNDKGGSSGVPYVPVGFMSWLKHAVHKDGRDVKTRKLKHWNFSVTQDGLASLAEKGSVFGSAKDLGSVPSTPMTGRFDPLHSPLPPLPSGRRNGSVSAGMDEGGLKQGPFGYRGQF